MNNNNNIWKHWTTFIWLKTLLFEIDKKIRHIDHNQYGGKKGISQNIWIQNNVSKMTLWSSWMRGKNTKRRIFGMIFFKVKKTMVEYNEHFYIKHQTNLNFIHSKKGQILFICQMLTINS
jgi:hypothetical protein